MPKLVLVVDDSPLARTALGAALREAGLAVSAHASAEEAARADLGPINAAVLDIELTDGFGAELAERLRKTAPRLPVAFLTGGGSPRQLAAARAFGPVFSKLDGLDEAVAWATSATSAA